MPSSLLFSRSLFSLVFIENNTIKYDDEKCQKNEPPLLMS